MNIGMHVSFRISFLFFSDIYQEVESLGHMVVLFSNTIYKTKHQID